MTTTPRVWLTCASGVDLTPRALDKLQRCVRRHLIDFPDICEGVIVLGGIEHFFTYMKLEGGEIEMFLMLRDNAEAMLNEHGQTTHEEWSPLSGSEHRH